MLGVGVGETMGEPIVAAWMAQRCQLQMGLSKPIMGVCSHCCKLATLLCSICQKAFYCCKEHQAAHWKVHRSLCKCYTIVKEPSKRPYLKATRMIPKGRIILKSKAVAIGPSGSTPVCLGCLRPLIYDIMSNFCKGCGWPVCNKECEQAAMHKFECNAMQEAGYRFSLSNDGQHQDWRSLFPATPGLWLLVLRTLLLDIKSKLLTRPMENDSELKYCMPFSVAQIDNFLNIGVGYIKKTLKIQKFESKDIYNVAKVVLHSLFCVEMLQDHHGISEFRHAAGVHTSDAVFLQHSCWANTRCVSTPNDPTSIKIVALRNIKAGEILTINGRFEPPSLSTFQRHSMMFLRLERLCVCLKCKSPSELNFHFGSLSCKNCQGMLLPQSTGNILSTNWACERCGCIVGTLEYSYIMNSLQIELMSASKSLSLLTQFIEKHSSSKGLLHKNHSIIFQAKALFCQSICYNSQEKGAAYEMSPKELNQFKEYSSALVNYFSNLSRSAVLQSFSELLVTSRNTIFQWAQGNIKNATAQMEICAALKTCDKIYCEAHQVMGRAESVACFNTYTELARLLARLQTS